MKYTKDDLVKMSGFEISKELCILRGLVVAHEQYMNYSDRDENVVLLESDDGFNFKNWNDIMPLAVEHNLTLQNVVGRGGNYWMAGPNTYHHYCDASPQRAIACCLILVLQEQQQ
jgi:hypothetical protein